MEVALYKTMYRNANAEMIEFAMKHLNRDKYPELLKRYLEKNGYYLTVSQLGNQFLNPEEFSSDEYSTIICSLISNIYPLSDDNLIATCADYLTFVFHCEIHQAIIRL